MSKTTIPTGGITADAIDATLIADDAISEEHLDATAITGHTALGATPADTDELLVSDAGTLKRVDYSYLKSGTLVELSEATVSSNVGSYFFSNVFSATYDSYFLDLRKLRFASDSSLQLRFTSDTGTSEFSGAYYNFAFYGLDSANNEERDFGNGDNKIVIGPTQDADSSSDGGIAGHMYFYNPYANNSNSVTCVGQFGYRDGSNKFNAISLAAQYSGTAARYGLVLYGGQQIAELRATLYGIVK